VFVDSQEDEKSEVLEPELKNRCSVFNVFEALKEFITTLPRRLKSFVYGVAPVRHFAMWSFVGKQAEQLVIVVNKQLRIFKLRDNSFVDFDPDKRIGSFSLFFVFNVLQQIESR